MLSKVIGGNGNRFAEVAAYESGHWGTRRYLGNGKEIGAGGSDDFELLPGHSYAVYSDRAAEFAIAGSPSTIPPVVVHEGWNLVSLPRGSPSAYAFMDSLLANTPDQYVEIDAYSGGRCISYAYEDLSAGLDRGPADFALEQGRGYAVFIGSPAR